MVPSLPPHTAVSTHPQYGVSGGIILLFAKALHQPRNPVESEHWNLLPSDFTGKIDFMRFIMKAYRVRARECAFIGDGDNDVPMAEKVGLSIAFNAQSKLREVCTHMIDQPQGEENFHAVAEYLDRYRVRKPLRG
jgi:hydroxymethylpyrimidine pyrophosphatase-like HAD family hydrolase